MKKIIISIILLLLLLGIAIPVIKVKKAADKCAYGSGVSWLHAAIEEELDKHYYEKGFYPKNLNELTIPFPGDGADPDMLKHFTYTTDGKSFKLVKTLYGRRFKTVLKGKTTQYEYSVDE